MDCVNTKTQLHFVNVLQVMDSEDYELFRDKVLNHPKDTLVMSRAELPSQLCVSMPSSHTHVQIWINLRFMSLSK